MSSNDDDVCVIESSVGTSANTSSRSEGEHETTQTFSFDSHCEDGEEATRVSHDGRHDVPVICRSVGTLTEDAVSVPTSKCLLGHLRGLVTSLVGPAAATQVLMSDSPPKMESWRSILTTLKRVIRDVGAGEEENSPLHDLKRPRGEQKELSLEAPPWLPQLSAALASAQALHSGHRRSVSPEREHTRYLLQRAALDLVDTDANAVSMSIPKASPPTASRLKNDGEVDEVTQRLLSEARMIIQNEHAESLLPMYHELRRRRMEYQASLHKQLDSATATLALERDLFSEILTHAEETARLCDNEYRLRCTVPTISLQQLNDELKQLTDMKKQLDRLRSTTTYPATLQLPECTSVSHGEPLPLRGGGQAAAVYSQHLQDEREALRAENEALRCDMNALRATQLDLEARYEAANAQLLEREERGGMVRKEVLHQLVQQRKDILESVVATFGWQLETATTGVLRIVQRTTGELVEVNLEKGTVNEVVEDDVAVLLARKVVAIQPQERAISPTTLHHDKEASKEMVASRQASTVASGEGSGDLHHIESTGVPDQKIEESPGIGPDAPLDASLNVVLEEDVRSLSRPTSPPTAVEAAVVECEEMGCVKDRSTVEPAAVASAALLDEAVDVIPPLSAPPAGGVAPLSEFFTSNELWEGDGE